MPTNRSSSDRRTALSRLLVTLLAVLVAEALLTAPRRPSLAAPAPEPVPTTAPPAPGLADAAAAGVPGGTVAIAVAERRHPGAAGRTPGEAPRVAVSGDQADRPFPSASLVKLYLAADVLHRARSGQLQLGPADRELLAEMIRRSDDPAASEVWVRFAGEQMVTDVAARYGLTGTAPPPVRGQWGQTPTTARDVATFLSRLPVIAHADDAAALLGWMAEVTPTAADGFDQRFGLLSLPGGTAAKQGWMCCVDDRRHLHSVGVREGGVTVLLSELPADVDWATARAGLDAVAAALPAPPRPRC